MLYVRFIYMTPAPLLTVTFQNLSEAIDVVNKDLQHIKRWADGSGLKNKWYLILKIMYTFIGYVVKFYLMNNVHYKRAYISLYIEWCGK